MPKALSSSTLRATPTQFNLVPTSHSAVDAVNSFLGNLDNPPAFQKAVVASFATAENAPPIPVALEPTGMVKKLAAVVPTLDCGNAIPINPTANTIDKYFFILNSINFTGNRLLNYCQFAHFFITYALNFYNIKINAISNIQTLFGSNIPGN